MGYAYPESSNGTAKSVTDGGDAQSEADSLLGGGGGSSSAASARPGDLSRGTNHARGLPKRTPRSRRAEEAAAIIPVGLGGRGESDGDYDEGWRTGLEVEEEEIGLLAAGGSDRVRSKWGENYAGWS